MNVGSSKIKYLYLPVGGTGERLKRDRPALQYASKCFLTFDGEPLLQRILDGCLSHVEEIVVVYCTEAQRNQLERFFADAELSLTVHLLRNPADADPYSLIPTDGDVLAVMGDSYVPKETLTAFLESIHRDPCLTFLRFFSDRVNQPTAYYRLKGDCITDWSPSAQEGYSHFEIGQILYFPKACTRDLGDRCRQKQAIHALREMIRTSPYARCLLLPCYNINTGEEYDKVMRLARMRTGEDL